MSGPKKLAALLGAIGSDGTVLVHVDRAARAIAPIEPLINTARRHSVALALCLDEAACLAETLDELEDMVEMSQHAHAWLGSVCLHLALAMRWANR